MFTNIYFKYIFYICKHLNFVHMYCFTYFVFYSFINNYKGTHQDTSWVNLLGYTPARSLRELFILMEPSYGVKGVGGRMGGERWFEAVDRDRMISFHFISRGGSGWSFNIIPCSNGVRYFEPILEVRWMQQPLFKKR